jgi:1-acyl-sn-glycerol-3-phosphate acyltransferase
LPTPPRLGTRILGLLRASPALVFLPVSLLALNLIQVLSLAVRPVSRRAFRRINREVADLWWGWCASFSRILHGIQIEVTGDPVPERENAIVLINHQSMADITFLLIYARSKHRLGDLKWFAKAAIRFVPGIGWGLSFLDCIFVERDWTRDRGSIQRTFAHITRDEVPLWLVSFPEGTRLKPAKLEASRAYAESTGLDAPENVLVPRTKGFVASLEGLRGHAVAVYDITVGYVGGVPTLWQYVMGYAPRAHLHVRRHLIEDLPDSEEELSAWLLDQYRRKDDLLAAFYERGSFAE